jgi:hypothetical protein
MVWLTKCVPFGGGIKEQETRGCKSAYRIHAKVRLNRCWQHCYKGKTN